ncbi:hypothetical protein ACLOJK_039493 [Asimina triloba]
MAWFFLAHVTIPSLSTVMFYYQTEFLHLKPSFLGTVRVVGWLGLMLGTFTYNRYLKHIKLRRILMWAHFGLATLNIFDLVLVSRLNLRYDIPDQVMVLWGSALSDIVNQLKMMPFLIVSGQLCPPGIEGTLFALFMSVNNLGNTLSSFLGAGLASILSISSKSFDNLFLGISIQAMCTFIPIVGYSEATYVGLAEWSKVTVKQCPGLRFVACSLYELGFIKWNGPEVLDWVTAPQALNCSFRMGGRGRGHVVGA